MLTKKWINLKRANNSFQSGSIRVDHRNKFYSTVHIGIDSLVNRLMMRKSCPKKSRFFSGVSPLLPRSPA